MEPTTCKTYASIARINLTDSAHKQSTFSKGGDMPAAPDPTKVSTTPVATLPCPLSLPISFEDEDARSSIPTERRDCSEIPTSTFEANQKDVPPEEDGSDEKDLDLKMMTEPFLPPLNEPPEDVLW